MFNFLWGDGEMNEIQQDLKYNTMPLSSIASFAERAVRPSGKREDVYFLRGIGCNASYVADIEQMDAFLQERQLHGQGAYLRWADLPRLGAPEDIAAFRARYDQWHQGREVAPKLAFLRNHAALSETLGVALNKVRTVFCQCAPGVTASMEENFMVKLLFWLDRGLAPLLEQGEAGGFGTFVYTGQVKRPEYLLCYLLTLLGIDVLILSPTAPLNLEAPLLKLSVAMHLGAMSEVSIPACRADCVPAPQEDVPKPEEKNQVSKHKVNVRHPGRESCRVPPLVVPSTREELAFEQLALFASSVVMIEVLDYEGQVVSGGSGIMVGEAGYILTNHHVASKGGAFSVHIEEDETVYHTNELIKTHALLDLALIRVSRSLRPIPIYQDATPLVRGQKVVAIGSPLGLFNSVSNGIISGFRTIDEVPMIQFTAPTSPGSSGGALLNMYGEVIGISTAGIDRGQNLNLAVGYQNILPFIQGFLK